MTLLVVLEAQTYHDVYRSGTDRSRLLVVINILCYFVHQRLLVPFGLGVLLLCVCTYRLLSYMYTLRVLNKQINLAVIVAEADTHCHWVFQSVGVSYMLHGTRNPFSGSLFYFV